jgi:dolichol-phosphate mannosyltransferase
MTGLDPRDVVAVVPCHGKRPSARSLSHLTHTLGGVVVVDDGNPDRAARALSTLAESAGAALVRLPRRSGKGHAIVAGIRCAAERRPGLRGILLIDADGQHPLSAVPAFLAAAEHVELVIGDRLGDARRMPTDRRVANRLASLLLSAVVRRHVRDTQCGMRLLRGRALTAVRFPGGGFEAETRHLKRCIKAGVTIAWVPIPAIYNGAPSSFRPVKDSVAVLGACLGGGSPRDPLLAQQEDESSFASRERCSLTALE